MIMAQDLAVESNHSILLILGLSLIGGVILALVIWQLATTYRAKTLLAREHAYRELAERTTNAQAKTAEALNQLQLRLAAVEKLLREVG